MLKITEISFPGLGIEPFRVNSVAFTVFGRPIAWYAIIIACAIAVAVFYVSWRAKQEGISTDTTLDIALFTVIIAIIGARVFYVVAEWDYYGQHPDKIVKMWEGGLAIYGALIFGGITVFVMCHIKKISFMLFADCTCPSLLIAQAMGRWGNFFNSEAHGSETDIFCRMGLNHGFGVTYYHPTFLYESLWNLLGFIIANFLFKHRKYNGFIFEFVFAWYGFGRMFIELLRTDSLYICSYHAWFTKLSVLIGFGFFVTMTTMMIVTLVRMKRSEKANEKEKENT